MNSQKVLGGGGDREKKLAMVVHTANPNTKEAEAGGLKVWGQPGLHRERLL